LAIQFRCSQIVAPGGGATPPTITSPTSPSACAEMTWMVFELRIYPPLYMARMRVIAGAYKSDLAEIRFAP
jgi:hypothetical protein